MLSNTIDADYKNYLKKNKEYSNLNLESLKNQINEET